MECYGCGKEEKDMVFMGKHHVCTTCIANGDESWESVEINFSDKDASNILTLINEEKVTLNIFVTHALRKMIERSKNDAS